MMPTIKGNSGGKRRYCLVVAQFRQKIILLLMNSITLCIRGGRTVANNEETIIRLLSDSTETSKLLPEMNVKIFKNSNSDAQPMHQSIPREVRQYTNIVKHFCIATLLKSNYTSYISQNKCNTFTMYLQTVSEILEKYLLLIKNVKSKTLDGLMTKQDKNKTNDQ